MRLIPARRPADNASMRSTLISTILVVHQDSRLCELLQLALGNGGYDVCVADDAEDAMSQFRRHNPDLVVLDLAVAAGAGSDFVTLMKGKNVGRTVPLFVISEGSQATSLSQALEIGAEECLSRPFSAPELLMKVRRSLERIAEVKRLETACADLEKNARKLQGEFDLARRELTEERSGVQSVMEFHQRIDPELDRSDIERRGLLQAVALLKVTGACLFQSSGAEDDWVAPDRWHGLVEDRVKGVRLPRSGEFLRILTSAARPLKLEDFERVPGTSWEAGILSAAGFVVVAPLLRRGELVGVLGLTDRIGPDPFIASDLELLGLFTATFAQILEASRARQTERTIAVACVREVIEQFEERSPFLVGHSRRVARMADLIGRQMSLSARELEHLQVAALFHDVGMSRLAVEALTRPGSLSLSEWEIVKAHPTVGAEVAARAGLPDIVRTAILHHHENWGGGGYPAGIGSREIPLLARVIAVAQCHEAMSSRRPWRGPLSSEDVQHYLAAEAGLRYDPQVVDAALTLIAISPALDAAAGEGLGSWASRRATR
jgi:putative nucleotidyltransferase with HDIG domain